jgi:DNA-binding PadR family transcriptional regulator
VSAKHAILGLVIAQPGYARRIAAEARSRLRFADLADSYPYWALERLEAEGLVRQVYENGAPVGNRGAGRQAIYEASVKGVRAFEDWLRSTPGDPPLRDDVQLRLAVARPADVPRLVELIRDRELVCAAHEQALEDVRSADLKGRSAWHSALRHVARDAELTFWHGRIGWLRGVRERLEGTREDDTGHRDCASGR